jgi:GAF domain-containing protein
MSIFHLLNPVNAPPWITREGDSKIWRERILQSLLLLTAVAAFITYFIALPRSIYYSDWTTLILYSIALVIAVGLPFIRKLPYTLRAQVIIVLFYFLSLQNLIVYGVTRNGTVYLLGVIILTGLFFGPKPGIFAIFTAVITILFFSFGMSRGFIRPPLQETLLSSMQPANWLSVAVHVGFLGGFTITAIHIIINTLSRSLNQQRNLTDQLNASHRDLEKTVELRTEDVRRRLTQLRAAATISKRVSTFLDPQTLLQDVVELIKKEFDLYYVGAFLLDERGEYAKLEAGTGEAGQKMLATNHSFLVGSHSMVGWATAQLESRIAVDTGKEAVRFENPHLPFTRSEMAIPIVSYGRCLGALTIQSEKPEAFDEDDIRILEGISDSIAIALENARLFQQTQQNLDEIRALNQSYLFQGWKDVQALSGGLDYSYQDPLLSAESENGNWFNFPLSLRDQVIGNLSLEINDNLLSPEEMEFIDSITTQTAIALENARLIQQTQQRAFQEQKLNQMAAQFSRATNIDQILKLALRELSRLPNVTEVNLQLNPPELNDQEATEEVLS